jgi:hypothetical protein
MRPSQKTRQASKTKQKNDYDLNSVSHLPIGQVVKILST